MEQRRYRRQLTVAAEGVNAKDREPVGPFDQLHGSAVTRVQLDGIGYAPPGDEVDTIHTDQTQPGSSRSCHSIGQLQELALAAEQRELWSTQDAAAVAKPGGAESRVPDQLAGEAQDPGIGSVGSKGDGSGGAGDPLLEIHARCHRSPRSPGRYAVPATRPAGFEQPGSWQGATGRWPAQGMGTPQAAAPKDAHQLHRISGSAQRLG